MGGNPFRSVIFNAREEALSSDLNRMQLLASKSAQDALMNASVDSADAPINAFARVPSIAGVAATFTASLGAGEAEVYNAAGVTADDSAYRVVQWAAQALTLANPDGANPRIDLVVVTPATLTSDNSVRNILLNALTRAFAPALVPKTSSSVVVPVVVTGTPGATPAPPAVPAGAFALFEVYVPAAAPDATTFVFTRRMQRRAPYPFTGGGGPSLYSPQCGVLRGCKVLYTGTFEAISSAGGIGDNAVVIDGEVIEFATASSLNANDTLNNPFAAPAPVGSDKPYFLYLVGGRNLPAAASGNAVQMVASLTPPNIRTGRPTSAIGAPRGTTSSAVYVGIGFVRKNTANHQVCRMVGDRVYCASNVFLDGTFETQGGIFGGAVDVTLASAPSVSDEVVAVFSHTVAAAPSDAFLFAKNTVAALWQESRLAGAGTFGAGQGTLPIPSGVGPHLNAAVTGAGSSLAVSVVGYNANVRRLG